MIRIAVAGLLAVLGVSPSNAPRKPVFSKSNSGGARAGHVRTGTISTSTTGVATPTAITHPAPIDDPPTTIVKGITMVPAPTGVAATATTSTIQMAAATRIRGARQEPMRANEGSGRDSRIS